MSSFGERLAELRRQKGLSQAELARLLNMGQSTIAMYEKNKRAPDHQILKRLADFFGVSTDYLLGRTDERFPGAGAGKGASPALGEGVAEVMADPLFADLLRQVPGLTEEEKQSLAAHWKWALRYICKERERRRKGKGGAGPASWQDGAPPQEPGKT